MAICNDRLCGCAITTTTLSISGSGTPDDPWVIDEAVIEDIAALEAAVANLQASMNGLPSTYVAKVGDEMSGPLVLVTSGHGIRLIRTGDAPFMDFYRVAGTRIGYIQADSGNARMDFAGEAGIELRWLIGGAEMMRLLLAGQLVLGKTASNIASTGVEIAPTGAFWSTRVASGQNFRSNKTGAGNADGEVHFRIDSAGTQIGSITRATATTVAYNTSSDETWKTNIFEIDDDLAEYWARLVQPLFFEFIASPGTVHGGYIAQRLAAVWPEAISLGVVTPGVGTQDDRTWDDEGNETTPDGVYRQWMIDLSKMVPFIHAAWQATDRRVTAHDERITRLELALEGAAAAIDQLQKRK